MQINNILRVATLTIIMSAIAFALGYAQGQKKGKLTRFPLLVHLLVERERLLASMPETPQLAAKKKICHAQIFNICAPVADNTNKVVFITNRTGLNDKEKAMFIEDLKMVRAIVEETRMQLVPLSRIEDLLKEEGISDCKIKVTEKK